MKSWYLRAGQSPQPIDFHSHNFPKRIFCSSDPHYPGPKNFSRINLSGRQSRIEEVRAARSSPNSW
jgi:hypothetical protein